MSIPQPRRDEKGKVVGDFYPLQREEILALRKAKVINNAAYVHLALRYENPFCDRPIEVFPKEFAMRWQMPESSVYEAIGKLKEIGAINIKYGKVVIEWINQPETLDTPSYSQQDSQQENLDSQQDGLSGNLESSQLAESRISEFPEKILDSQKEERIVRKHSESSENDIYIDRARALTDSSDRSDRSDDDGRPPTVEPVKAEILEEEQEEPTLTDRKQEQGNPEPARDRITTNQQEDSANEATDAHEDHFSAAANAEILKNIERIAHNWRLRPWMASATRFKPEMVKAVWQCNPAYYSCQGTSTPNQTHIIKALKLRDNQLKSMDLAAVNAYHELHQWWQTAQALANPHVQHAFVAAANQSKEQVEELERQRKVANMMKALEGL